MLNRLLLTTALTGLALGAANFAAAQTTITEDTETSIATDTAGDITINNGVLVSPATEGSVVTINSDNSVINSGTIATTDLDNVTGIEVQGGNTGNLTQAGLISITEEFSPADLDDDLVPDEPFAIGSGRTGILISGASPFVGNIEAQNTSTIVVEGNDSYGIRLAETSGLTGNLSALGNISVTGDNSVGISLENQIIGQLAVGGAINTSGTNAAAINIEGDIDGGFTTSAGITNSGYRFTTRPSITGRDLLDEDDLMQAASAISVNGNITNGILLDQEITTTVAEDGTESSVVTGLSSINQFGNAPAILIDGQGTPIAIGMISTITDPDDENFTGLNFAFVNEGTLAANGVFDDIDATAFEVRDATLSGGISNIGSISASTFRSGDNGTADAEGGGFNGIARVLVIGNNAIAEQINNSGFITANVAEADDSIFSDRDAVQAPRPVEAIAIDIEAGGDVTSITNSGFIASVITARTGEVIAIRDASGTLRNITNTGSISALAGSSDADGVSETSFTRIALDLRNNTSGVSYTQSTAEDLDPDDDITPIPPSLNGDILLGSGDDIVTIDSGTVLGDIAFAGGANTLSLSGNAIVGGAITADGGTVALSVSNSSLLNTAGVPLAVTTASFDETSSYNPTLDGSTGAASTLVASGDISFADGAEINPILSNIIGTTNNTFTIADAAGSLNIGGDLDSLTGAVSPFLYDTTYAIDPNDPNALIVTLDLRETSSLGLDSAQTAAFNSAFEALGANAALGNAFVNLTDESSFNQAFNQLLPEFAAAARQFVIANVDGATGAVGSHLDNVRRSQERPGGAWIQEFAYFADRDLAGLSEQYRGFGFGFNAGIDTALGPFHAVGITAGFASTEIESVTDTDDPFDVLTIQLGAYAAYEAGNLGIEAIGGFGFNDFESQRNVIVDNFTAASSGDWSGTHYNGSLRAGYDFDIGEKFFIRPAASLDYISLSEDSYTETGNESIALDIDSRTSESGSATAMLNFGGKFYGKRTWIRPALRVGYRNDFINDGVITTGRFVSGTTPFQIESESFPSSGFLLGLSVAAGSEYSSFSFDLDSDIRDGFIRHTGRVVLRLLF